MQVALKRISQPLPVDVVDRLDRLAGPVEILGLLRMLLCLRIHGDGTGASMMQCPPASRATGSFRVQTLWDGSRPAI